MQPASCNWDSDGELVDAILANNEQAWKELYHRCQSAVNTIARSSARRRNRPDIEDDLTQECWLQILKALPQWKALPNGKEDDLCRFVSTVAKRKLIELYRASRQAQAETSIDDRQHLLVELPDTTTSESNLLAGIAMRECLKQIAPRYAVVLRLMALEGLSAAEAMEILGANKATIAVWKFRAMQQMRHCLEERRAK